VRLTTRNLPRGAGTIHQPSIDIFEAFDDLLLMKSGGFITYHGPLGQRSRSPPERSPPVGHGLLGLSSRECRQQGGEL